LPAQFHFQILAQGGDMASASVLKTVGADFVRSSVPRFAGRFGELGLAVPQPAPELQTNRSGSHAPLLSRPSNRIVFTAPQVLADSSSGVHHARASNLCGTVRSNRQIASPWRRQWRRANRRDGLQREVTPVQAERGERGVVHRGDAEWRMESHRPRSSACGIDGGLSRLRHTEFICGNGAGLKRKVQQW